MKTWTAAAHNYREYDKRQQQKTSDALPDRKAQEEQDRQDMANLTQAMNDLERFIITDGREALELLSASKRHIVLGEEKEGGGMTTVYFLDGKGLQKSVEVSGTSLAYLKEIPKPAISNLSVMEAVMAAVKLGRKDPKELVTWLRGELDKIAAASPATAE